MTATLDRDQRFGEWTVIESVDSVLSGKRGKRRSASRCRCTCGTVRIVFNHNLVHGRSTNCGCVRRQKVGAINRSHGAGAARVHGSRAANIWLGIIKRCYLPTWRAYHRYGGRGIAVCDRWRGDNGFHNFLADMGEPPTRKHSIGRIDNDGPYAPENCRWETSAQQMANTRANVHGWLDGQRLILAEISRREGISHKTLRARMAKGMYADPTKAA